MAKSAKKRSTRKSIRIEGVLLQETFSNKNDANEWYAEQLRRKQRIQAGMDEPIVPSLITVEEFSGIFMRKRAQGSVVKGTWRNDGARLGDYIIPLVGKRVLQSIKQPEWEGILKRIQESPREVAELRLKEMKDPREIDRFKKKLKRHKAKLSNTTRNLIRTLVHTLYEEAIKAKVVFSNPIAHIDVLDQGDPEDKVDYWETQKEVEKYLTEHLKYAQEIGNYSWYLFASWALGKGPRVNELTALNNGEVDVANRRVRLSKIYDPNVGEVVDRTKGSRKSKKGGRKRASRWLMLNEPMMQAFLLHQANTAFKGLGDPIFVNRRTADFAHIKGQGYRLTLSGITNVHGEICERAGLRVIRIHDLRHTFAAHFLMNGGSLHTLAEILGHSTAWVTEKYGHLSESYLEKESDRVIFNPKMPQSVKRKSDA